MVCNFSLLLITVSEVLNTYIKHCFLVNSAFLLPFSATLEFVCVQLGLEIFQLILGQKVCHYLGGDKGGWGQGKQWQRVTRGEVSKIEIFTVTYFLNGPFVSQMTFSIFCG